ncbi:MAG: hypothetical protein K6F71_12000 [Ruminococcus sp.]|uniref:hypothetical protein n=1 Tax=Ruminococcus sp. TaxID=41978 RepID=UPI0025F58E72|nr:hypothetical protein [Ruminococcus sp.]MCR5541519.1 hypothetical protein [Ruminococcus sp.]
MFTFERTDRNNYDGECNIMSVSSGSQEDEVRYPGQAITLFGQPDFFTEDYENIFSMVISAKAEDGEIMYLEIYQGPSGPAIGGKNDDAHKAAAKELAEMLKAAKPADYDWEGDYEDIPVHIKMGIKNGTPYYDSDMPDCEDPWDMM